MESQHLFQYARQHSTTVSCHCTRCPLHLSSSAPAKALHPLLLFFLSALWLSGHVSFSSSALHLCHQQLHQSPVWCEVRRLHTNGAETGFLLGSPEQWGHGENIRQHHSARTTWRLLDWGWLSWKIGSFGLENILLRCLLMFVTCMVWCLCCSWC